MRSQSEFHLAEMPARVFKDEVQAALQMLLDAHECAKQAGKELWEFSLELEVLERAGLSRTNLRWLLDQEFVQQAVEVQKARAKRRSFEQAIPLSLCSASCFILTAKGLSLAQQLGHADHHELTAGHPCRQHHPELLSLTPRWLADPRELRLGAYLIKKFRRPANSQTTILTTFEEDGWPVRIDNPLPPTRNGNDTDRLHEAIRRLNHGQHTSLLRFHGDGTGEGVTWEIDG